MPKSYNPTIPHAANWPAAQLWPPQQDDATQLIIEVIGTSNIRSEPQVDASLVGYAYANETYTVLETTPDNNWYKIRLESGTEGWIGSTRVTVTEAAVITTDEANEVPAPSQDSDVPVREVAPLVSGTAAEPDDTESVSGVTAEDATETAAEEEGSTDLGEQFEERIGELVDTETLPTLATVSDTVIWSVLIGFFLFLWAYTALRWVKRVTDFLIVVALMVVLGGGYLLFFDPTPLGLLIVAAVALASIIYSFRQNFLVEREEEPAVAAAATAGTYTSSSYDWDDDDDDDDWDDDDDDDWDDDDEEKRDGILDHMIDAVLDAVDPFDVFHDRYADDDEDDEDDDFW